jgi:hypothetical protein
VASEASRLLPGVALLHVKRRDGTAVADRLARPLESLGRASAEFETTQPAIGAAVYSSGRSSLTGMITSAGIFKRRAANWMASALGAS